jgi:hypothetical protein
VHDEQQQPGLELKSFTYEERSALLPALTLAIVNAGGWVLRRCSSSMASIDIFLEIQAYSLPDVYAAMLASGLELTRDSHRAMAERCNCSLHLRPKEVSSILAMRLEIHFLVDSPAPLDFSRFMTMGATDA